MNVGTSLLHSFYSAMETENEKLSFNFVWQYIIVFKNKDHIYYLLSRKKKLDISLTL
jgi:hypothetical protein